MMISMAVAAAGTFMSPVSHAANLLVMGPGGYKFIDFLKVGAPLTLVTMIIVLLLLPVFWPL
jgi:di/tricarboxylate transporter